MRVDSGVGEGSVVGSDYDPMLAKVVGVGTDRREALAALDRALGELVLLGPGTNIAYLRALLARPEVRAGAIDTGLIERLGEQIAPPPMAEDVPAAALEALLDPDPSDPWAAADGWRIGGAAPVRATLTGPDGDIEVEIAAPPPAAAAEGAFSVEMRRKGQPRREVVREAGGGPGGGSRPGAVWILDGRAEPVRFALADEDREHGEAAAHAGSLEAPMPGTVITVRRGPGEAVEEGEVLVVVESMKMELAVQSPAAGTVAEVLVAAGEQVERGQTLVLMGEDGATA